MTDKLMYIPNEDTHPIQITTSGLDTQLNEPTNQNSI